MVRERRLGRTGEDAVGSGAVAGNKDKPPALVIFSRNATGGCHRRITAEYGKPASYAADRGFDAPGNRTDLELQGIMNGICPPSVPLLREKLEDSRFRAEQTKRGSTEGRIGIFKNAYLGPPLLSKGFRNRRTRIAWRVLAHNPWKLGSMVAGRREELRCGPAQAA